MIQKPKLKGFLTVFPISDSTWGVRGGSDELWRFKLTNEKAKRTFTGVLPYLDGKRDLDEILDQAERDGLERGAAQALLNRLEAVNLIENSNGSRLPAAEDQHFGNQLDFFARVTNAGGAVHQASLRQSRIALVGGGEFSESVLRQLDRAGFGEAVLLHEDADETSAPAPENEATDGAVRTRVSTRALDREAIWTSSSDDDELPDVFVVAQEAHDPEILEAMDAFSKRHGVPWMLMRALSPQEGWVGPLFVPDETACYLSLEVRLRGNVSFYPEYVAFDEHLREGPKQAARCGNLNPFLDLLSSLAVIELVKLVSGISMPQLAGRFLTINLLNWETELHDVLRVPRLALESAKNPIPFAWKKVPFGDVKTSRV